MLPYTVCQETSADVWNTLKSFIAKSSIDREFALHEQIQLLKRESCESLEDYLRQHKLLCDEVAAIGKALSKDRKAFWMLQGLDTIRYLSQ